MWKDIDPHYFFFIFAYTMSMKKIKNEINKKLNKKIKIITIIGFFVISIFGTLFHFTYDFSNKNIIVGIFSAVNESVYEHIKIIIVAIFMFGVVEIILLRKEKINYFGALLVKIICIYILVPLIFYTYTFFTKKNILFVDILTFYFSILMSQIVSYKILVKTKYTKLNNICLLLLIIISILTIIFTFCPPKLEIFRDSITNTYGIFGDT